jgi:hypothetical protein
MTIGVRLTLVLLLCVVGLVAGCGGDKGPKKYDVSGMASFDGVPIEKGSISFVPRDTTKAPEGGTIENGKFKFQALPGAQTVEIRGSRPAAVQDEPLMGTKYEDFVPAQFNSSSYLKAEVTTSGPNTFTFDLKTQELKEKGELP